MKYLYRVREQGQHWIAERRHPLWFWHYLSGSQACWHSGDEYWAPSPNTYPTAQAAEDAIKTAIVYAGINYAHHMRVRHFPPWRKA